MIERLKDKNLWANKILPIIMEYGIYLVAVFLFTDKGETFRSIGLYIPPTALAVRVYITKEPPFNLKNPVFLLVILLCLSGIIASIFAPLPADSFRWFKKTYFKLFLLFMVVSSVFRDTALLTKLARLFAILSVLFIVRLFYDYATKAILPDGTVDYWNTIRKYIGPLELFLPFVLFAIILFKNRITKIFWSIILILGIIAVLLTGVRGGWIGTGMALLIWVILYCRSTNKRVTKTIPCIAGVVVTILIILNIIPSSHITQRLKQGFDTSQRAEMTWKASIENYKDFTFFKKIIGNGLDKETMYKDFDKWYKHRYHTAVPSTDVPRNPHNFYLYLLYTQGIIGLFIYLLIISTVVKAIYSASKPGNTLFDKIAGITILSAFMGAYVIHGLFEDLRFMPLGILLGMAGAYLNLTEKTR